MTLSAACAAHPDRPAQGICGRCGTFICIGCTVSGDLCTTCRSLLHRDGVAWTDEEKARARARTAIKWSIRSVRLLLGAAGSGALCVVAATRGTLPPWTLNLGWTLLALALVSGLVAAAGAVRGYLASREGRPGPAVAGVVSGGAALTIGSIGIAPVILALVLLLSR
jgi:hypothetical protein